MQCALHSRVRIILGYVLFLHIKLATYLHKHNFINGEENVINFTLASALVFQKTLT